MNDVYQDDLKAYLDKELPLFRRLAVREHLTRCASCREEITQMTQMTTELRKAEADHPVGFRPPRSHPRICLHRRSGAGL